MNRIFIRILFCLSLLIIRANAQSYSGPSQGSIPGGVIQSTDFYPKTIGLNQPKEFQIGNEETETDFKETPDYFNFPTPTPKEGSNYYTDKNILKKSLSSSGAPILFQSFNGINMTNSIPPDPNLAVGPTHILAIVNTAFSIWDKSGNLLKNINGAVWVNQINPNVGSVICDPKILYDHFNSRWVMVWMTLNSNAHLSYWTISVSQDSVPIGTWYSWSTPSYYDGSDSTNYWSDYEGVGFDKDCIYISGNQWDMSSGSEKYSKIRIIPSAQLYANTAGPIIWWDIWGITIPGTTNNPAYNIRPSYTYGTPGAYYLVQANSGGSNYISLYKITNPVTAPVLTGVKVPVTSYSMASAANQLGGCISGTTQKFIDVGGSTIQNEPKFRDGYIWLTHCVGNPLNTSYSALHYVKIAVDSNKAVEDVVFGSLGNYYFYPATIIDKNDNLAITFSRSGDNEYIGSYYTSKLSSDPPGLLSSYPLQAGKGNYVVDYGSGRNRWGDYSGFALDPSDGNSMWMISEFASSKNIWGTYIGGLRLIPYSGVKAIVSTSNVNFGNVELTYSSSIQTVIIKNYGSDKFNILNIPSKTGPFTLIDSLQFPISLGSYDSLALHFNFTPGKPGYVQDTIFITNNDSAFTGLVLSGKGYQIVAAAPNTFYASSGINNSGNILSINRSTGSGTNLGPSLYNAMTGIAVHPKSKIIYGISSNSDSTEFARINATAGDAYNLFTVPTGTLSSIAFDTSGNLYAANQNGLIYSINLLSNSLTQICSTKVKLNSIAFDSKTNELWGTPYFVIGLNKDAIFKINLLTGDTSFIGKTSLGILTNAIAFDEQGNLFGVTGAPASTNNFISINKTTGASTLIGSIRLNNITGLSWSSPGVTGVNPTLSMPVTFSLSQNYPNPFNPSTAIEYSLAHASYAKITIYNILGEEVDVLDNSFHQAGSYKVIWNPGRISSGVYFYELKAVSSSGEEYTQMKKMVMLK